LPSKLTGSGLDSSAFTICVYSTVRRYRSSCGVSSLSASRSFLKPPASMFRKIRRPCRNASDATIFAAVYGCM
jgi:hypothetical protein